MSGVPCLVLSCKPVRRLRQHGPVLGQPDRKDSSIFFTLRTNCARESVQNASDSFSHLINRCSYQRHWIQRSVGLHKEVEPVGLAGGQPRRRGMESHIPIWPALGFDDNQVVVVVAE
eukprot:767529-Hanusia_phi.AAC.12